MGDFLSESDDSSAQGSIFPFLSVLCCVIGTMVLILIAGSLNAAGYIGSEMKAYIEEANYSLSQLGTEEEDLSKIESGTEVAKADAGRLKRLTDLNDRRAKIESGIADAQARLEQIMRETAVIRAAPAKKRVMVQQERAGEDRKQAADDLKVAQSEVDGLMAERKGLATDRDTMEKAVTAPKTGVRVDGVDGPYTLIDLDVDKLTLHSDLPSFKKGDEFTRTEAVGKGKALERLAIELARPGNKLHPVLLVRPNAIELHDEAERVFRRWRVDFTREPVDEPWEIAVQ